MHPSVRSSLQILIAEDSLVSLVFALNEKIQKYLKLNDNQKVIGYLYVGTATGKQKNIPEMDTSEFVTEWI